MTPTSRIPRLLLYFATTFVTSLYMFPFVVKYFPVANTKMILAAISLVLLLMENLSDDRRFTISKDFLTISFFASLVGLVSLISITYNRTNDREFVDYIMSAWVWMGGAYTVIRLIKRVHGTVSLELLGNYLVSVCVFQCILSYLFVLFPDFNDTVGSIYGGDQAYMIDGRGRLHGLGCALDPAGLRFSATLIILAGLICNRPKEAPGYVLYLYVLSFFIISLFGNMISRSTTVGMAISLGFMAFHTCFIPSDTLMKGKLWITFFVIATIGTSIVAFFYNTNEEFHDWLRFGFEGFFSLVEEGSWNVSSNEILKSMVVYPETTKTWIIGDGYINANAWDPYYLGEHISIGYYMDTDIGYLRYIFYFGIIGLVTFGTVFLVSAVICSRAYPKYTLMFLLMMLSNFIGWIKVSTDIFCMFAPFLVLIFQKQRELYYENRVLHPLHL